MFVSSCNRHGMRQKAGYFPMACWHSSTWSRADIAYYLAVFVLAHAIAKPDSKMVFKVFFSLNTISRRVQCRRSAVTFASAPRCVCVSLLTHILMGSSCVNTSGLVPPYETKDDISHFDTACLLIVFPYTWPISWSSCSCRAVRWGGWFPSRD